MRRLEFPAMTVLSLVVSGCATIDAPRGTCALVGGILGAAAGAITGHNVHDDHNHRNLGGAIGAGTGALAGYLLCSPGGNQPPTARATAEPSSGNAPLSVELHGVGEDVDGQVVSYAWALGDGTTETGAHGKHIYQNPGNYTARLTVTDDDGATGSASVDIAALRIEEPEPTPPKVSERIILRGVNFDFDRAEIRPEAEVILDTAAEVLSQNEGVRIEVAGHTDSTGEEAYNQGLSERRAQSVADYLASKGIERSRLVARGYGESSPVADNGTRDGRAQNRRVELKQLD